MLFRVVSHCTTGVIALSSGEGAVLRHFGFGHILSNIGLSRTAIATTTAIVMAASTAMQLL